MISYKRSDYEDITPKQAIQMQEQLRKQIQLAPFDGKIETIGGADISFDRGSDTVYAGVVSLSLPSLQIRACSLVTAEVSFPYIPGLLAYREIPAVMRAWKLCRKKPDLLVMDGHGIAHPRRMGIATHFGILADHPTIGCAKNVLTGEYIEPGLQKGSHSWLKDGEEKIGVVLRSRTGVNPIFISPGYKTDFESSIEMIQHTLTRFKLPETTREIHRLVNELRRSEIREGYFEYEG